MAKIACKILGGVLILAGVIGVFTHNLLGMHLTPFHNGIHLVTGAIAFYFGFAGTSEAAHMFSRIIGAIYLLLGILGFITPGMIERILQIHTTTESVNLIPDNVVHLLLGAFFSVIGFLRETHPVTPAMPKAS